MGHSHSRVRCTLNTLAAEAHMSKEEIRLLHKSFKDAAGDHPFVNKEQFDVALRNSGICDKSRRAHLLSDRLFDIFDKDKTGKILFKEFISGLSILVHGDIHERIKVSWELLDLPENGNATAVDVQQSMEAMLTMLDHVEEHFKMDKCVPASQASNARDVKAFVDEVFADIPKGGHIDFATYSRHLAEHQELLHAS